MKPRDLLLYLVGNRGAIERIAATRHAWLVGAILVLTAGIARNYDHLDLLQEPEWFIGPFAASLVSTGLIFMWLGALMHLHSQFGRYWRQAGTFLVLVWLTAPCAWLYAIPIEAMTDIVTATKWNIAFLAIVAFWRVAIIVRAVSVLLEARWQRVLLLVLAPAALEAMVGSFFKGMSLVGIMGGIRLPPETEILRNAAQFTAMVSFWLALALLLAHFFIKGSAKKPLYREPASGTSALWPTIGMLVLAWLALAVCTHPPLANRHQLEQLIRAAAYSKDYAAAITFAASKTRQDFPRHHYLPPKPSGWFPPLLLEQLPADAPAWLRDEWIHNAVEFLNLRFYNTEEWQKVADRYPEIAKALENPD